MNNVNNDPMSDEDNYPIQSENEEMSGMIKLNCEPYTENPKPDEDNESNEYNIIFPESGDDNNLVVQNNAKQKDFIPNYLKANTNDWSNKIINIFKNIFSVPNKEPISKNNEEEKRKEDLNRYGTNLVDKTPNTILKPPVKNLNNESKIFEKSINNFFEKFIKKPIFKSSRQKDNRKDNMVKKIKSDLFKGILTKLNKELRKKNIIEKFDIPQLIVTDTSKSRNRKNLNMDLEEMLTEGVYNTRINEKGRKKTDNNDNNSKSIWKMVIGYFKVKEAEKIQKNNKNLINKLRNDKDDQLITILNMKMEDIYKEYLNSQRFEKSIERSIKKENYYYVYKYIKVAKNFVSFCKSDTKIGEDVDDGN